MSAKMDLPIPSPFPPTVVDLIPEPEVPPENPPPRPNREVRPSVIERLPSVVSLPQPEMPVIDARPPPDSSPVVVPETGAGPARAPAPVRAGPRFVTPPSKLKPPYPLEKRRFEEEAVLRLRLAIDERGRVTAVEPVGRADPVFLAAARRHVIANWRYQPASEDGRPIASSTVVTLRFQLDD